MSNFLPPSGIVRQAPAAGCPASFVAICRPFVGPLMSGVTELLVLPNADSAEISPLSVWIFLKDETKDSIGDRKVSSSLSLSTRTSTIDLS